MRPESDIARQVLDTIRSFEMVNRGDKVVVAVSGGPDSVALLYLLRELHQPLGLKLHVAHLDHGLRGAGSRADARYTERLAGRLGLPVTIGRTIVPQGGGGGLEEEARIARYAFLQKVASTVKAQRIATGHNADDQAETVLMRILRGAGSAGLAGIPPVRGNIVRPLIQIRRHRIEEYLRRRRLRPHQDPTNQDLKYLRNRVRRRLIPRLEKHYNPNIVETLNRIGRLEAEESVYFHQLAESLLKTASKKGPNGKIFLDLSGLAAYFNIGGKYLILEVIRRAKGDLRRVANEHVDRVLRLARDGSAGTRVHLPDGLVVERSSRGLHFRKGLPHPFCESVKLPGDNEFSDLGLTCEARIVDRRRSPGTLWKKDECQAFLDWDRMHGPFVLRTRQRGDRLRPLGMKEQRKLSDYLSDRKIPRILRDEIPLLVGGDGIIWVVGCGICDPFKVTERTRSVLWARCDQRG